VPTPVVTAGGDGTVPAVSATALGLVADRQHPVPGLEHSTACRDPQVRDFTAQLFGT
jgi:hypothetical protein